MLQLAFEAVKHTLVKIFVIQLSQFCDAGEIPPLFEHIGEKHDLFERAHVRSARGMVTDGVEHVLVLNAEGMLCKVCTRVLMQNGCRHLLCERKSREFGRSQFQIFRRVVQTARLNDVVLVQLIFRGDARRHQRHAHRMLSPRGFHIAQRRLDMFDAVQLARFDILDDVCEEIRFYVFAEGAQHARLGGGNVPAPIFEKLKPLAEFREKANLFGADVQLLPLAAAGDQFALPEDLFGFAPGIEIFEHIRPDEEIKLRVGVFSAEIFDCAAGVACAARIEFVGAHFTAPDSRKGELCHVQPILRGRHVPALLVRRHKRRHDNDFICSQLFRRGAHQIDVLRMDGVERPAEYRDLHVPLRFPKRGTAAPPGSALVLYGSSGGFLYPFFPENAFFENARPRIRAVRSVIVYHNFPPRATFKNEKNRIKSVYPPDAPYISCSSRRFAAEGAAQILHGGTRIPMKRFDLPLWSDTVFVFSAAFLLFFCIFRFYLNGLWAAALCAFAAGGAAGTLFFLFLRARRKKKHTSEGEKAEIGKLAFHLAMDSPEHNAELIAKCLTLEHERAEGTENAPPQNAGGACAGEPQNAGGGADTAAEVPEPFAHIRGGHIDTENGSTYLKFQFEAVTADELSPVIRAEGEQKTVLGASFTDEAQKLAAAFGVTLKDAAEVYTLVKESGCMPEALISPPEQKRGFRAKLAFRVRRSAWRGYLFSGAFLLLFSLFTIFPVYYVVSGGVLLAIAAAVRFFGKKD